MKHIALTMVIMFLTIGCSSEPPVGTTSDTTGSGSQTSSLPPAPGPRADPKEDSPAGCFERYRAATVKGRYELIYDELAPKSRDQFVAMAYLQAGQRCRSEASTELQSIAKAYGFNTMKAVPRNKSGYEKMAATIEDPRAYLEEIAAVIILHDDKNSKAGPTIERYRSARLKDVRIEDTKGIGNVVYTNGMTKPRRFERIDDQWHIVVSD